jgi:4'-phosphopantetheinyl transferase
MRDGERWLVARAGLRALLGQYLDVDPAALTFSGPKPRLDPPSPLRFNLSHSGDVGLVACARVREVGVDVERVRPRRDIARRGLLRSERTAVTESSDPLRSLHEHWVAKEAFLKATGRVDRSLRSFEVDLAGPEAPRFVQVGGDPSAAARWSLRLVDALPSGYVAAVVAEGAVRVAPLAWFDPALNPDS